MWTSLLAFLERYPGLWTIVGPALTAAIWAVISGLFNSIYDSKSPHTDEEWAAAFLKHPRWAAIVSVFKTAGLNIPGLLRSLRAFFGGRLPDPVLDVVSGTRPPTGPMLREAARQLAQDQLRASRVDTPTARVVVVDSPDPGVKVGDFLPPQPGDVALPSDRKDSSR
mgnify:CR=1 FL=1